MVSRATALLHGEPSLDDLFEEPIVQLIMQRDGVVAHDMRAQISRLVAAHAAAAPSECAALS